MPFAESALGKPSLEALRINERGDEEDCTTEDTERRKTENGRWRGTAIPSSLRASPALEALRMNEWRENRGEIFLSAKGAERGGRLHSQTPFRITTLVVGIGQSKTQGLRSARGLTNAEYIDINVFPSGEWIPFCRLKETPTAGGENR
jgi:hypothetical protein